MKHVMKYLGIGLALALAAPAFAGAHTYNTKLQTIRCGVLLANRYAWADGTIMTGASADANHPFNYVFQALNARPDVKPYAWDIVNPHAAPYMDGIMAARYGLTLDPANPPQLNKNMGPYWEVYLHESTSDQLSDYDVLYMPMPLQNGGVDQLTVDDREKLRRAVDAGVTLWIDNGIGGVTSPGSGQIDFVNVSFGGSGRGRQFGDTMNALMSTPNALSTREIAQLGARQSSAGIQAQSALVATALPGVDLPWTVTTAAGSAPTIEVTQYGQGAIVITSRAMGRELTQGFRPIPGVNNTVTGQEWRALNTGPICGADASRIPIAELKFLINLISYKFQSSQPGGGARHASGSRQDLNTPLSRKWQFPENFKFQPGNFRYAGVKFVSDPVVWNGICYAATSDMVLRAYDMDPGRDLDGDGNPDDGVPNPTTPSSDRLWEQQLPGPCSSLVVADVNNRPRLFGMLADGRVFAADGLPRNAQGRISGAPVIKAQAVQGFGAFPQLFAKRMNSSFVPGEDSAYRIPAPVWYNGRLFVVGVRSSGDPAKGYGAVAEINPNTLQTLWEFPDGTADPSGQVPAQSRLGIPSATPTIAAIQDNGYSGATDIMLLVPSLSIRPEDLNGNGVPQASRIVAFPIAVRGEKLLFNGATDINDVRYWTRFTGPNDIAAVNVNVWVPTYQTPFPGTIAVDTTSGRNRMYVQAPVPAGFELDARVDYDFAPQAPANGFRGYNARWVFDAWSYNVAGVSKYMEILTTPVVASDGTMYWVASDVGYGANQAPIVMGVQMRPQNLGFSVTGNPNFVPPLNTPQLSFIYTVGSQSFVAGGCNATPTPQPVVLGTPAVDRGILYVPWGNWHDAINSVGGVTGFFVQNTTFGLLLAGPVDPTQKGSVSISERNQCTGDIQQVGYGSFDVDNITIGSTLRGLLTFHSLSAGSGGAGLDLSRPGDILVSYPQLDLTTAKSNPVTNETPTVYYKTQRGEGSTPDILKAFSSAVPVSAGGGVRTGVTVAGGSIYIGSDSGDLWTVQLPTSLDVVKGQTTRPMQPATYPSLAVAGGFGPGNYPADPGAALRSTPVIANGTLIENAPVGLYAFYSPRTLITDSSRIIEVAASYAPNPKDPTGIFPSTGSEALWMLDSTIQSREFGSPGAGALHPPWAEGRLDPPVTKNLNQPSMAIRVNSTNTLICDTGNNRVVEVDRTGNIIWQCTEFADPYGLLGPNESHTLSSPTSVQRWETTEWDANNRAAGLSQHNLIADFGNNRILEVVTRFTGDENDLLNNVVVWVGRGPAGKGYQFYQAQREALYKPGDVNHGSLDYGRTIASVINLAVNSAEVQSDDSALASAKTDLPATAGGSLVILGGQKDTYTVRGTKYSAAGKVIYFLSKGKYENENTTFALSRPVYFNRYVTGDGAFEWRVTMTDGANIFELKKDPNEPPGIATVLTTFPNGPIVSNLGLAKMSGGAMGSGGYTTGTTMSKRLSNGNLLMVNQKTGSVFEYSPTAALAGSIGTILIKTSPDISGTAALTRPVYADRLF